jgi:cation diffusion facilitator CzcD-associated flavoprotein CzcO
MVWHVAVSNKETGETEHWIADFVCQCVGSLDRPKWGNTPGRENFKGTSWHTAYWRHDCDLTGKKVAIIGCGPSAAQILPEIIDKPEHVTVYMRTPPVCIARGDFAYSRFGPRLYRHMAGRVLANCFTGSFAGQSNGYHCLHGSSGRG